MSENDRNDPNEPGRGRFRRFARRVLDESEDGKLRIDAREVLHSVLEGSDRAKTEVVKAVAREVRTYLEEMGIKDDVHNLLTNYSVEVKASLHLRRLADAEKGPVQPETEPES